MMPVRGATSRRGLHVTSDGKSFPRLAYANAHQRSLNSAVRLNKLMVQFGLSTDGANCNPVALGAAIRENPLFRKRFMLAVNY